MLRPQTIAKFLQDTPTMKNVNIWGLEAAAIPRRVKALYIKGIANVLTDSVSRLKSVGPYHDTDSNNQQQEFSTHFEPISPVEPVMDTPLEVNEAFISPDIESIVQTYDTLHDSPTAQTGDDVKLSLENASPTDIPQLEENIMSLPELTPEKVIKLQRVICFEKLYST